MNIAETLIQIERKRKKGKVTRNVYFITFIIYII